MERPRRCAWPWYDGQRVRWVGQLSPRTVDIKKAQAIVADYLAGLSNKNLMIDEIMEFENNLYALIKESDTG